MPFDELKIPKINVEPFAFIDDFQTRLFVQYADIIEKTDDGRSVVRWLSEDPRVTALNGKLISHGSGAQAFHIRALAMWFLWCANQYGSENARNHLDSFLDSEEISAHNTLWVLGIEVDQPIVLRDGYTLQSINHMPDSRDKESFLQARSKLTAPQTPAPVCAITKACRVQKAHDGNDPPLSSGGWQEFVKVSRRLHDIAFILNTLNGISCLPYYSTSYVDPTTPLGPFGGSGGGMLVSDVLTHELTKLPSESSALIDNVLMKYDKLNHSEKMRTERILNRLSQAKRRTQIEDKILDLGIALEMLLLQDNSNREQLSLSFRLRGSWLMGQSPEDRHEKYLQLRDIYSYRSDVAHGGVLCGGEEAKIESVRRSFPEYQRLAEDICRKIITDGKPHWTRLILGKSNSDKTT
ncbi:MAG: hypothetical protein EHM33_20150 [Chloroflexi bacterium]|nr:MAG: hypothetical protein EHM33_20150 [Chloroflexota bacterium]